MPTSISSAHSLEDGYFLSLKMAVGNSQLHIAEVFIGDSESILSSLICKCAEILGNFWHFFG